MPKVPINVPIEAEFKEGKLRKSARKIKDIVKGIFSGTALAGYAGKVGIAALGAKSVGGAYNDFSDVVNNQIMLRRRLGEKQGSQIAALDTMAGAFGYGGEFSSMGRELHDMSRRAVLPGGADDAVFLSLFGGSGNEGGIARNMLDNYGSMSPYMQDQIVSRFPFIRDLHEAGARSSMADPEAVIARGPGEFFVSGQQAKNLTIQRGKNIVNEQTLGRLSEKFPGIDRLDQSVLERASQGLSPESPEYKALMVMSDQLKGLNLKMRGKTQLPGYGNNGDLDVSEEPDPALDESVSDKMKGPMINF